MKKLKSSLIILTLAIVTSCATPIPIIQQVGTYSPPDMSLEGKYSETINKNFDDTWTAVIDFVSVSSFSIDNFEKDSGLITLTFGISDPGRYIDCGSFKSTGGSIYDFDGKYVDYIHGPSFQGSSLSGKMNISIRSVSEGKTNVRVNARYIWVAGTDGRVASNTWSFDTGNSATIFVRNPTSGTIPTRTCVPTYHAESSVIDFVKSL
tara:strand:- start:686 stop:1306 length:621 start_codon:yes stop_codon:yes gene_type:complete